MATIDFNPAETKKISPEEADQIYSLPIKNITVGENQRKAYVDDEKKIAYLISPEDNLTWNMEYVSLKISEREKVSPILKLKKMMLEDKEKKEATIQEESSNIDEEPIQSPQDLPDHEELSTPVPPSDQATEIPAPAKEGYRPAITYTLLGILILLSLCLMGGIFILIQKKDSPPAVTSLPVREPVMESVQESSTEEMVSCLAARQNILPGTVLSEDCYDEVLITKDRFDSLSLSVSPLCLFENKDTYMGMSVINFIPKDQYFLVADLSFERLQFNNPFSSSSITIPCPDELSSPLDLKIGDILTVTVHVDNREAVITKSDAVGLTPDKESSTPAAPTTEESSEPIEEETIKEIPLTLTYTYNVVVQDIVLSSGDTLSSLFLPYFSLYDHQIRETLLEKETLTSFNPISLVLSFSEENLEEIGGDLFAPTIKYYVERTELTSDTDPAFLSSIDRFFDIARSTFYE